MPKSVPKSIVIYMQVRAIPPTIVPKIMGTVVLFVSTMRTKEWDLKKKKKTVYELDMLPSMYCSYVR